MNYEDLNKLLAAERERCAGACEAKRDERFSEHGIREPDTGACYYGGRSSEEYETRDDEDEECASAVRALHDRTPEQMANFLRHAGAALTLPTKAAPDAAQGGGLNQAASDVLAERARQISAEGWTPEHDDGHDEGELCYAAAGYCVAVSDHMQAVTHEMDDGASLEDVVTRPLIDIPWPHGWEFKPATSRRLLVKAGALILAEIERLDRASPKSGEGGV